MLKWLKSAGKLTSLLAVSPASHTALRAGGKGARTSATCGPSSHASSEKSDPLGYLLRTSLASGLQQRTRCSLTWTRRATPAGRSWWVLTTLGRPTAGSACGLSPGSDWPTAKAADGRAKGTGGSADHGLDAMARKGMLWPTHTPNIHAQVIRLSCEAGPHDQAPSSASGKPRGSLSPAWVAQLMGAPDDWLASTPPPDVLGSRLSETASSPRSSRKSAAPSSRRKSIFATFLRRKQGI